MNNYYKYLPVSEEDEGWGLTVLNAGCASMGPDQIYPDSTHPEHHHLDWKKWRVLKEYQIIYITRGQGIFESSSLEQTPVKAGTLILLFPDEKHRYKPDQCSGWDEHWIGVKGPIIDNLVHAEYLNPANPCLFIGFNETIFNLFQTIIAQTKAETPGYQPHISGATIHLLGLCHAILKQNAAGNQEEEMMINKARLLFRSNISNSYSAQLAADELNVGYSSFRKLFKNYTGLSPGQYYLQLKIEKAKELLSSGTAAIKEIALELNFDSSFYFSKIFKEKTGLQPTEFRKKSQFMD